MLRSRYMTDSDVDHALMNHLAIVLGFSQLLLQDATLDDPRRGNLAEIHKAATAAMQLMSARVTSDQAGAAPTPPGRASPDGLEALERNHIVRVLEMVRGNKLVAARRLGISRRTLYRRLARHGLR